VHVSYELRALAGRHEVLALAASEAGAALVRLPQGCALLPVTGEVFDQLGGGAVKPFGDVFWFLSGGIDALARRISRAGAVAYLEADIFGGTGTQATVLWQDGEVRLGPVTTQLGPPVWDGPDSRWAFNQAFRYFGTDRGSANDEFAALGLGRWRSTEGWAASGSS